MPRTNYQKGADKERRIVNRARDRGCLALRSAGSHSPIDVVIVDFRDRRIKLVQSKPASMSDKAKEDLHDSLQYLDGFYEVDTSVE